MQAAKVTPIRPPVRKARNVKINAAQRRSVKQVIASVGAGFLPVASYVLAHVETAETPALWVLVAAALTFSAPTLAAWARTWTGHSVKAWGFTVLLEGVMVASHIPALSLSGLVLLVAINASNAWTLARKTK